MLSQLLWLSGDGHDNRIEISFCLLEEIHRIGVVANNAMPLTRFSFVILSNGMIAEAPGLTIMSKSALRLLQRTLYLCLVKTIPLPSRIYQHERNNVFQNRYCQISFHHIAFLHIPYDNNLCRWTLLTDMPTPRCQSCQFN